MDASSFMVVDGRALNLPGCSSVGRGVEYKRGRVGFSSAVIAGGKGVNGCVMGSNVCVANVL